MKIDVVVTSYNHEKYINQCIDSILAQRGEFEMEIILGDDVSTDHTPQILQKYVQDVPGRFISLPNEKNLGITRNLKRCLDACTGDYIAICEGDDYWTDPDKLQKQMKFLELHADFSMCFSAFKIYYEEEKKFEPHVNQLELDKEALTIYDLLHANYIGNFSCCMYRSATIKQLPPGLFDIFTVDWMFNMACSEIGKIGFIREPMSVYRKHSKGAWTGKTDLEQLTEMLGLIDLYDRFFLYKYDRQFMQFRKTIQIFIDRINGNSQEEAVQNASPQPPSAGLDLPLPVNLEIPKKSPFEDENAGAFTRLRRRGVVIFKNIFRPYWRRLIKFRNDTYDFIRYSDSLIERGNRNLIGILLTVPQRISELIRYIFKKSDLVILDTIFPHPSSPFRYEEFITYLDHFPKTLVFSTCAQIQRFSVKKSPQKIIQEFELEQPAHKGKTIFTKYKIGLLRARLAYTTFLGNMDLFLETLEKNQIPFVFTLYPGGGFEVDQPESDNKLYKALKSPQFRKVIATQKITYDYLLQKKWCPANQIEFIYGVVTPMPSVIDLSQKQHFGFGKEQLDICFVAYKYMEQGIDKGYDVFIETARKLSCDHQDIHFHVVGTFDEKDLPIEDLAGKITFHGMQTQEWFNRFYQNIDIILSPNIPFILRKGAFDGFPTASCTDAGLQEVAIFCTDELDLNIRFTDRKDLVIIPHDADKIATILEHYYNHPDKLREVAQNGAARIREIYNYENQLAPRLRILEEELGKLG